MKKTIKFDLPIDGVKVRTVNELRDHFTVDVLEFFRDGRLEKWLHARQLDYELTAVQALSNDGSSRNLLNNLGEILGVDVHVIDEELKRINDDDNVRRREMMRRTMNMRV